MPESVEQKKKRILKIFRRLDKTYPGAHCALDHSNPLELLVATILSAQCTDKRVNLVTPALFARFKTAVDYAAARPGEIEALIRSTGFYQSKARHIREAARDIAEKHGGKVPKSLDQLVQLRGVGRKTANVVLGNAFGIPGMPVDTHMIRINGLLKLTKSKDPVEIEKNLTALLAPEYWTNYSHLIITHGRQRCVARRPDCAHCEIDDLCPSRKIQK